MVPGPARPPGSIEGRQPVKGAKAANLLPGQGTIALMGRLVDKNIDELRAEAKPLLDIA